MSFSIKFSLREKDLLINLLSIESAIVYRLNRAVIKNDSLSIKINTDELDLLLGSIAADANHPRTKKLGRELDSLFSRVNKIYEKKL